MRSRLFNATALLTLTSTLALPGLAAASSWDIDPAHTEAEFKVRHMMISNVTGQFSKVTGTVELDDKDVSKSTVDATIDVTTVDTREAKRDEHLKSPEFLDVAKFPTMTFKSKKVSGSIGHLKVTGDLTIHGVTKEVVLNVDGPTKVTKDPWGNERRGLEATTKVDRKDFGLNWNKSLDGGGVVVGDEVKITINAELTKKKAP